MCLAIPGKIALLEEGEEGFPMQGKWFSMV